MLIKRITNNSSGNENRNYGRQIKNLPSLLHTNLLKLDNTAKYVFVSAKLEGYRANAGLISSGSNKGSHCGWVSSKPSEEVNQLHCQSKANLLLPVKFTLLHILQRDNKGEVILL